MIELCLGHSVDSKTELTCRRTDLLRKRRGLLSLWAAIVAREACGGRW